MSNHNNTSGEDQSKIRKLLIKSDWFIKPYFVIIEVWEDDKLIIEWLAAPEVIQDKQLILNTVTKLVGGGVAQWIN